MKISQRSSKETSGIYVAQVLLLVTEIGEKLEIVHYLTQCMGLYYLLITVLTNYHKLGGLTQQKFILLQLWRQESKINFTGLNLKC